MPPICTKCCLCAAASATPCRFGSPASGRLHCEIFEKHQQGDDPGIQPTVRSRRSGGDRSRKNTLICAKLLRTREPSPQDAKAQTLLRHQQRPGNDASRSDVAAAYDCNRPEVIAAAHPCETGPVHIWIPATDTDIISAKHFWTGNRWARLLRCGRDRSDGGFPNAGYEPASVIRPLNVASLGVPDA